jgi:Icc-related predicted phosphoesterase
MGSVIFAGLEGSILYNYGEHQYTERQMQRKISALAPALYLTKLTSGRYLDVLVTHAPPLGIHDRNDPAHRGFKAFLKFISRYHPKYLLHGHTHIYDMNEQRIFEYEGTKVVNCYNFVIIDIKA